MNCVDQALVTSLALNFFVNAILICYLLPNTYINSLLEDIFCRKCVGGIVVWYIVALSSLSWGHLSVLST